MNPSAHELEAVGVGVLAEQEEPAEHAELNASETAAEHEAVGGELGNPELADEVTIEGKAEATFNLDIGKSVSTTVLAACRASRVEDADTSEDEANEHGDAGAAEADVEAHGEGAAEKGHGEADRVNEVHGEVVLQNGGPASAGAALTQIGATAEIVGTLDLSLLIVCRSVTDERTVVGSDRK